MPDSKMISKLESDVTHATAGRSRDDLPSFDTGERDDMQTPRQGDERSLPRWDDDGGFIPNL